MPPLHSTASLSTEASKYGGCGWDFRCFVRMRHHRGKRSRAKKHVQNQQQQVTPPEMESEPEPGEESDQEGEDHFQHDEMPEGADPQQENVEAAFGEYFPAGMVQMEPPSIVPLSFGVHEFKIAMSRVEIEPENYIWAVKLVQDEEEEADCHCNFHEEEKRRGNYSLQENPI